jgi:alpha-galactosidase/6-phospho-beta-glucosidase family protein
VNREPRTVNRPTAAELDLDQIWHLVDDLLAEHKNWIPEEFAVHGSRFPVPR